jgi:curved DNA-binding protein CbpA
MASVSLVEKIKEALLVLELPISSEFETIKKKYRQISLLVHPDKRPKSEEQIATEEFKILSASFQIMEIFLNSDDYQLLKDQYTQQTGPFFQNDTASPSQNCHGKQARPHRKQSTKSSAMKKEKSFKQKRNDTQSRILKRFREMKQAGTLQLQLHPISLMIN